MPDVTMPDGTVIRNVPEGTTQQALQRRYEAYHQSQKPTSFWQGIMEGADKAIDNTAHFLGKGFADAGDPMGYVLKGLTAITEPYFNEAVKKSHYRGSTLGKVAGGVVATAPLAVAGGGLPVAVQGALQGALLTDNPNDAGQVLRDATVGAVGGKLGDIAGKRLLAPVAAKVANHIKGDVLPRAQQLIANQLKDPAAVAAARQNVTDAQGLGLPYALADASPKLRALAGSATRFSPDALAKFEDPLTQRSLGQIDRATSAINGLAPITDIAKRGEALKRLAAIKSRPFYRQAMSQPQPFDVGLNSILETPAGQSAMQRGYEIAANEGKPLGDISPEALSTGELQGTPSWESLQAAKRGLDSIIEGHRNELTGALNKSDPRIASLNAVRARLLSKLGELNPSYAEGNKVYSDAIGLKTALKRGTALPRPGVTPLDVSKLVQNAKNAQLQQLQRGYATQIADDAANAGLGRNPYERIAGSAAQQEKLGTLFPGKVRQFLRSKGLETDMAKTAQEVLGGSPTARRQMADAALKDDILGGVIQNGAQLISGGGINPWPFVKAAAKNYSQFGLGEAAKRRAGEVADTLLTQGGEASLPKILNTAAAQRARQELLKRYASLIAPALVAGSAGQLVPQ